MTDTTDKLEIEKLKLLPLKSYGSAEKNEQVESSEPDTQDEKSPSDTKEASCKWLYGYICIAFTLVGYGTATVLSQVSGLKSNVFQLCTIRYLFMAVLAYCATILKGYTFKMEQSQFRLLLICAVMHVVYDAAYFYSATFIPLGVLEGLRGAIMVIMAVTYDFYLKTVNIYCVLSAVIAIIGTILLSQPWDKTKIFTSKSDLIPCEAWALDTHNYTNQSVLLQASDPHIEVRHSINKEILGYVLIIGVSFFLILRGFLIKNVLSQSPVFTVLFWTALLEGLFSSLINLIYARLNHVPYFDVPTATYCFLFTFFFTICTAMGNIFSLYSFHYVQVTMVALGDICQSVLLYVCQRTFLKQFYPGHANAIEVVGVIVVIIGLLLPVIRWTFQRPK